MCIYETEFRYLGSKTTVSLMKRLFDILFSLTALIILSPLMIIAAIAVKISSGGSVLYWSERIGKDGQLFFMPKFRTMFPTTPKLATADIDTPSQYITGPTGSFLRKTSIDELPQFFSVLTGDMSVVGPRPVIRTERHLLRMRGERGIDALLPGVTGWAQINGRDNVTTKDKVRLDEEYLHNQSLLFDMFIILLTTKRFLWDSSVKH